MNGKRKIFKRISALAMSFVMVATLIIPALVINAESEYYTAKRLDMFDSAANNVAFGISLNREDDLLTPEIKAMSLSFGWSGTATKNNTSEYLYVSTNNDNSTKQTYKLEKDNAIMFYVKLPSESPKTELFFQMVASDKGDASENGEVQWIGVGNGRPVFYLLKGNEEWETKPAAQSTVDGTKGNLTFTAGFEGWVAIPYASFLINESKSKEIFRFDFIPKNLGGDYTAENIKVGTFLKVDDAKDTKKYVSVNGSEAKSIVTELLCHRTNLLIPSDTSGLEKCDNNTVINGGYTHITTSKNFAYEFSNNSISSDENGSVILCVRLPIESENKLSIKINDAAMPDETECFLLNRGDKLWSKYKTSNGELALNESFEGYIQLPVSAFKGLSGNCINSIDISADKTGFEIGSIMLSNIFDDVTTVRAREDNATYELVRKSYYNAKLIEVNGKTSSTPKDNNYYSVSEKIESNAYSMGIDNGYYYTFSDGTAKVGNYKMASSVIDPPYTAYLAENFTLPSGKAIRPYNSTAISFDGMNDISSPFNAKSFTLTVGKKAASGTHDSQYLKSGKFTISGVANKTSVDDKYYAQVNFSGIKWTQNGALMFYVKHNKVTNPAKETRLYLIDSTDNETDKIWTCLTKGLPYYTLKDGETSWKTNTTETNSGSAGDIVIPAEFSGWVRIPSSDFKTMNGTGKLAPDHMMTSVEFFPSALGKEYGSLEIGAIMTVEEGKKNYSSLKFASSKDEIKLTESGARQFNIDITDFSGKTAFSTDADIVDFNTSFEFENEEKLSSGKAFMAYIKQDGRNASSMAISLGSKNLRLAKDAQYYLFNSSNKIWSKFASDDSGNVEIPAGFSGWLRIPYEGLQDASQSKLSGEYSFKEIKILPKSLGGPYGDLSVGSFMIVNHSEESFSTMRVDKGEEIAIAGSDYYSAVIPDLSEVLAAGDNARTVSVSQKLCTFLKGGNIYTVSSKNGTKKSMDETSGVEISFLNEYEPNNKDSLILYVSVPSSNTLMLSSPMALAKNGTYYILSGGNSSRWEKKTALSNGSISFSSAFNGYIRIPFSSMKQYPKGEIKRFVAAFGNVGGSYGEPALGNIMFSDFADYDLYDVLISGIDTTQSLIRPDYYEGYLVKGKFEAVNNSADSNHTLAVSDTGNTLTPNIDGGYSISIYAPASNINIVKETLPCVHLNPDEFYTSRIKTSGAIMFYVRNESEKENALFFQAYGDIYATTNAAAEYSMLNSNENYWTKHLSNGNGDITVPAGFSGWIRIPYTSLKNTNGSMLSDNIKYYNFLFKKVGGEYKTPEVGSLAVLYNNGDFGQLLLEGNDKFINLYGKNSKIDYTRDDIAVWESVTDPFMGYENNDTAPMSALIDTAEEIQRESKFSGRIIENGTPFKAKGIAYSCDNAIKIKADTPRYSSVMPFAMDGAKGLVVSVKTPKTSSDQTEFFFQISTGSGNWLSVKHEFLLPIIEKGKTDWTYTLVTDQKVQIPGGFEGYIYFPAEYLATYKDSNGYYKCLKESDTVVNVVFGFGELGGEIGDATVNGIFKSVNGVLSHDGAYVDGSTECLNIFSGSVSEEEDVKSTVYDVPKESGTMLKDLPTPNGSRESAYAEDVTSRSARIVIDKYSGADRYRCDLYIMRSLPGQFGYTYYEFAGSYWTDTNEVEIDGLTSGIYYTLAVSAFKGAKGLCMYPLCSIFPESQIVGDMFVAQDDPYLYDWVTNMHRLGSDDEYEYEEIIEEYIDGEDGDGAYKQGKGRKKIMRRRRITDEGFPDWLVIVLIAGGIVLVGGATALIIIIAKKRRKKNNA